MLTPGYRSLPDHVVPLFTSESVHRPESSHRSTNVKLTGEKVPEQAPSPPEGHENTELFVLSRPPCWTGEGPALIREAVNTGVRAASPPPPPQMERWYHPNTAMREVPSLWPFPAGQHQHLRFCVRSESLHPHAPASPEGCLLQPVGASGPPRKDHTVLFKRGHYTDLHRCPAPTPTLAGKCIRMGGCKQQAVHPQDQGCPARCDGAILGSCLARDGRGGARVAQ